MKFDVGRTYMVSSPNGCSVYNSRYLIYKEIPAGASRLFVAQESELMLDDSEAVVTEVRNGGSMLLGELMPKLPEWFAPLKAELTALLDGSKFELAWLASTNTLVVHTDRVSDELGDAVTALLERVLPQNVEVERSNYLPMQRIMKKLPPLLDSALGGDGRHNLNYDEAAANVAVEIAYPNLDDESAAAVNEILAYELPPEVSSSCGYGVTPHVVDYLLYEFTWDAIFTNIFPKANYPNGFALPADMPEPEILKGKTSLRSVFKGSTLRAFPDSWTMQAAVNIFETFQAMKFLETFPAGMTFENVTEAGYSLCECYEFTAPETLKLTRLKNASGLFRSTRMTKLPESITFENVTSAIEVCSGGSQLRDISIQANFGKLSDANLAFSGCKLTKGSALRVLNTIPAYTSGTHRLTLGIHIDHQNDDEVLEAIANAEAKGWDLAVQWTGTPTAQASVTYGLRKPPIYARVGEIELPDGTTERVLDWGHYVTDTTGYEVFRSVESAREYFGLPDESLTETE